MSAGRPRRARGRLVADAHAVATGPAPPDDPIVWANAIFDDPSCGVAGLPEIGDGLVGLLGIERDRSRAFAPLAVDGDDVLVGADADHLDVRAPVRREPDRVVVTTVVRCHDVHGPLDVAVVRIVHPVIVRALLTCAASTLSPRRPAASVGEPTQTSA